ncbi:hypothetical protein B0H10DRAFT_2220447 [Mycena sp. CBHHK59/15]|nr:hypothetical protein B0H10DRAFT_2220447 [Mycena sp. CBHHK59/15]
MTTPHTATHAPTIRQDLGALVATVAKFTVRADSLSRMGRDLQDKLSDILDQLKKEDADDRASLHSEPAKDPATVKAEHASEPMAPGHATRPMPRSRAAPTSSTACKGSKGEALLFYKLMYEDNAVEKWVEVIEDDEDDETDEDDF